MITPKSKKNIIRLEFKKMKKKNEREEEKEDSEKVIFNIKTEL